MSSGRRYVIVGAGAIGGTVGGVLARAGVPTVLVARGQHAEVLATTGLMLRTPDGIFHTAVAAVSDADEVRLTADDVLVFATKTQQLDAALQQWVDRPVHGPDGVAGTAGDLLPVFTALNGVVAEEKALRYFRRVFGICVWLPAVHLNAGEVIVRSWPVAGQFHVARWPATLRTAEDSELLDDLAAAWTAAGIRVNAVDDVAPWKYNKLLSNLGNAVGALATGDLNKFVRPLRDEAERVLACAGIDFVSFEVTTAGRADGPTLRPVPGDDTGASSSTWQSLSRNTGDVETDFFNGEIVRIAHQHGIDAPLNAALARAARDAVRNHHGPGHYSAEQLAALLGA
ncbi:2-dehydropantoate 2-reductase N-terminal domain-containing protein [Candidatus Mycobacterium wuenschmannii]|uniref:2-dehydropantoate 2-reductase N-terminal domain-containing protein n=1 Tax=Candidatus Mycobacterium wuenschmannii TaxID=3027808 RepID=A0ABY8VZ74_9MYCO|nr:2-dehydropantoate 2-reductase N-terminal domain-containing protein [Candidatus Mycobacterium wuenschmannii]WIM86799.1 2-dehydropantoate 2-reductase N-terminal domain-containing protein [Candidatus Mycobacterium wuenschmannii]